MPLSPRLFHRILLKTRRRLGWRLFLQLLRYLPKVTLKAKPRILEGYSLTVPGPPSWKSCNRKDVEFNTILFFFFFFLATSVLVFIICNQVAHLYSICSASGFLLMKVMHIFFLSVIHTLV